MGRIKLTTTIQIEAEQFANNNINRKELINDLKSDIATELGVPLESINIKEVQIEYIEDEGELNE